MYLFMSSQVSLMNEKVTLKMSEIPYFPKAGTTNVALKHRIMSFQPNSGSGLGTLPGYIFIPNLKTC